MDIRFLIVAAGFLIVSCSKQADQAPTDEKQFTLLSSQQTGLKFSNPLKETKEDNHLVNDQFITGAGVAVGDINSDGLPDLFFTGNQVPDRLYLNKGNLKFEDITKKAGIDLDHSWSKGVTMADLNNDGHLDIYICKNVNGKSDLSANKLYMNQGDMTFVESAEVMGLADQGFSVQATFLDYDKDGVLEMYLINQPPSKGNRNGSKINPLNHTSLLYSDKLYKLMPNGLYEDISDYAGTRNFAYGLSATVGDYNGDGYPDIYVANDFDLPDHLYINQQDGTFKNEINQSVKHISNFSMGTDAADYNNDGGLDLMVLDMVAEDHKRIKTYMGGMNPEDFWKGVKKGYHYQYMFNTLQSNNGNGTFAELAHLAGVSNTDWSWGPLFADFDNDGWKDLFVTNGVKRNMRHSDLDRQYNANLDSLELLAKAQGKKLNDLIDIMKFVNMAPIDPLPNFIYKNNGDLTFTKSVDQWGMGQPTLSNGAGYADFDNDGDLDLIVSNIDEKVHLYRNNSTEQGQGSFVRFKLITDSGSPAYGARVELFKDNAFWQLQELSNARGFLSKSEDVLHFGLGSAQALDSAVVTWQSGEQSLLVNPEINKEWVIKPDAVRKRYSKPAAIPIFANITNEIQLKHRHRENEYDDYLKEVLLPHKMSNFGPGLAVGDVNGDGLEDFYVGGASGQPGAVYMQNKQGAFTSQDHSLWQSESLYEDLGAALLDVDGDTDLDLYVVSGGNEWETLSPELQDRLYLNNGKGSFTKATNALPEMTQSGSCVRPFDYDNDGDLDLFVGGRLDPGRYPLPGRSYILENQSGRYTDVTESVAPGLIKSGLVTDAVWADLNGDQVVDLTLVGEWMPVTTWIQNESKFVKASQNGLDSSAGWYYAVNGSDMDNDGDVDLIVGNLGLNYKYKASLESPFEVYYDDFDDNGSYDIVLSYYEHGEKVPLRGRSCSSQQVPQLADKYPTFEAFGDAGLEEIYGEGLSKAVSYQAFTFASAYLENKGDGTFEVRPLPNEAQVSSINNIIIQDFDKDGHLDLLTSGNLYPAEIETPRNDAFMGLYLRGDSQGNFEPVTLEKSGFFAPHDAKDMAMIRLGNAQTPTVLVANNNFWMQAFTVQILPSGTSLVTR